jgi:hypothetical protein
VYKKVDNMSMPPPPGEEGLKGFFLLARENEEKNPSQQASFSHCLSNKLLTFFIQVQALHIF